VRAGAGEEDATGQVVAEITAALGGVQMESPAVDYTAFLTSDSTINIDQFGHVIELYDFPQEMKTNDLMAAFHAFTSRWDIKWVDDTHALGVFSSAEVAAEALALRHPRIKSRPLNMATAQSKCKARAVCEYLLPYKPRPATSTAPARRLIQWALGSDKKVPAASKDCIINILGLVQLNVLPKTVILNFLKQTIDDYECLDRLSRNDCGRQ